MKSILLILVFAFSSHSLLSQDSLFIINHYAILDMQEKCKHQSNQLDCIYEQIGMYRNHVASEKNWKYEFIKRKRALLICHLNASWIYRLRGNYESCLQEFAIAESYVDSLKQWDSFDERMEDIMQRVQFIEKDWCFRAYRQDSSAFYACNCERLFPELNNDSTSTEKEEDNITPTPTRKEPLYRFGQFISNDTLIIAPEFVSNQAGTAYFETHQIMILEKLKRIPFSEILREISAITSPQRDTLILRIELISSTTEQIKKCSIVKSCRVPHGDSYYNNAFMQMSLDFPRETVVFYVPLVLQPVEYSACCTMDSISLGADHFLIQYERGRPLRPNLPKND